jgi:PleD family two-component response regulator
MILKGHEVSTANIGMGTGAKILVIDDESAIRETLSASLMDEGYEVRSARSGDEGLRMLEEFRPLSFTWIFGCRVRWTVWMF